MDVSETRLWATILYQGNSIRYFSKMCANTEKKIAQQTKNSLPT